MQLPHLLPFINPVILIRVFCGEGPMYFARRGESMYFCPHRRCRLGFFCKPYPRLFFYLHVMTQLSTRYRDDDMFLTEHLFADGAAPSSTSILGHDRALQ